MWNPQRPSPQQPSPQKPAAPVASSSEAPPDRRASTDSAKKPDSVTSPGSQLKNIDRTPKQIKKVLQEGLKKLPVRDAD